MKQDARWMLFGGQFSPFVHKLRPGLKRAGMNVRVVPDPSRGLWGLADLAECFRRKRALHAGKRPDVPADFDPLLDEYPFVPFLFSDDGVDAYDSTAILEWLDPAIGLMPEDPALAWAAHVIDEFWDEWGQCMALHQRWVVSGDTVFAGEGIIEETSRQIGLPAYGLSPHDPLSRPDTGLLAGLLRPALRPVQEKAARRFDERQIRRLPYHLSFAPRGFGPRKPGRNAPPSWEDEGFPPTHALLEDAYLQACAAVEAALSDGRPFLLGERFTIADASSFGVLYMKHFSDVRTRAVMDARCPRLGEWIARVDGLAHGHRSDWQVGEGRLTLSGLRPFFKEVEECFFPLVYQQEAPYETMWAAGQRRFNEAAFDAREALYEGEIRGHRYRHVVKTFQVKVARRMRTRWEALGPDAQAQLADAGLPAPPPRPRPGA